MKRLLPRLLLAVAAVLLAGFGEGFPVPKEPNQIFYVQRSLNANTIVYTARRTAAGGLDTARPVEVYWRRYNDDGERKELSGIERSLAFGVRSDPVAGQPGSFMVRVVSYPDRPALLRLVNGVPQLEMKVAGQPSRLDHAYLEVDDSGSVPHVRRVHLFGKSLSSGAPVAESFIP